MKLRQILTLLTLCTTISAAVGGYYYLKALKYAVLTKSEIHTVHRAEAARTRFAAYLTKNTNKIKSMAALGALSLAVADPSAPQVLAMANQALDQFNRTLQVDVCYLLNAQGKVLASSNRNQADSFVGKNYAFRPYFKEASAGATGVYMAVGVTSGKRGIYYSHPVYALPHCQPVGVAVIKSSLERIEAQWQAIFDGPDDITLVTNGQGVIFVTSRKEWLLDLLWPLDNQQMAALTANRQFGPGPWEWTGMTRIDDHLAVDRQNNPYLLHAVDLHAYPGWRVVQLSNADAAYQRLSGPVKKKAGAIIGSIGVLIGGLLFLLFRTTSLELTRRHSAETKLRHEHQVLENILRASPVAIGIVHNHTIKRANKAFLTLFKFDGPQAYEGKNTRIIYASEEECQRAGKILNDLAAKGEPAVVTAQLRRTDGTTFFGHLRNSAPDPAHTIGHTIFTISDISDRVHAEEERLKTEKIQSMLETAGGVCHELNQPLTAINGHCAIGCLETLPDEPAHARFEKILKEMGRVTEIIRKLNSLTRYKTRKYIHGTHIVDIDQSSGPPATE
jgi:PAS domain S-box-containing protein